MCKIYVRIFLWFVVLFLMVIYFNEKVVMDLKYWRGKWILYLIDMWFRYIIFIFI